MSPSQPKSAAPVIANLPTPRSEKIAPRHLDRLAMVYVRQSSPQQLVRHQESTQIQYSLKLRAKQLGWSEERILTVDDDQGQTASSAEARIGFQRMVSEVSLDHVGIILGVETSRLARSCDDWYPLLKVCTLFGTLIGDLDGIYDPAHYNDRLLLGLKGTMSEAELHILKQRMHEGRLNKARRGELFTSLPIGYVRRPGGGVAFDPDEQAQEVVRLIFRRFEELGTMNAVLKFLVKHGVKFPVRARDGMSKGDLEWHRPNKMTLRNMLTNPMYAGVYAYGRRAVDPRRKVPGRPSTGRTTVPLERCTAFLKDRFPAYMSWAQYESNQERLTANRMIASSIGAPKGGPSLLSGLVVCGKCGGRMSVLYGGQKPRLQYRCIKLASCYGEAPCQSLAGKPLDQFVSSVALNALQPASLDLSLEAAKNIERQRQEVDGLWKKRLERARYDAERAARQYARVEPENRLVARNLEHEWEEKLRQQKELEEEFDRSLRNQPRVLSAEEREEIRRLSADIPSLWNSPLTTLEDRKEILRQVIDRVAVDVDSQSERVKLTIHWAGGTSTDHEMVRRVKRREQLSYWPKLADRIRELAAQKFPAHEIAARLNEEGWVPPSQKERFGTRGVQWIMNHLGLTEQRSRSKDQANLGEHEWWVPGMARELQMPSVTLYLWLKHGWVKARRSEQGRWILWADADELARLRKLRSLPPGYHTRRHWTGNLGMTNAN